MRHRPHALTTEPGGPCPAPPPQHLYSAEALYDAWPYDRSLDSRTYAWTRRCPTADASLAEALHDHAIDTHLLEWVDQRRVVGVMGGHDLERDGTVYRDAVRLGWLLGQTHTVATGGGPGAMEAANLGARLAGVDEPTLRSATAEAATVPSYMPDVTAWARAGLHAIDGLPSTPTLGIPTWFYGHEPPNVFATAIAKYFRNATREAVLLQICHAGIVFLPGAAGTVQEIFQDACENYYATGEAVAPMVLVGREHWTRTLPAWQLLTSMAVGREMGSQLTLVDSVEEAAAAISG